MAEAEHGALRAALSRMQVTHWSFVLHTPIRTYSHPWRKRSTGRSDPHCRACRIARTLTCRYKHRQTDRQTDRPADRQTGR